MFEKLPLNDIHMPEPVSWWPPAIGWWLVPVVLVVLYLAYRLVAGMTRRFVRKRRLRRQALAELAAIEEAFDASGDAAATMERVSVLLRRVAMTVSAERRLAGRAGQGWVEWLRRSGPRGLDGAALDALAAAPYRRAPAVEVRPVLHTARDWITHALERGGAPS